MRPTEPEIKEIIRESLSEIKKANKKIASCHSGFRNVDLYKRSMAVAMKYCNKALRAEGMRLKELCLYILGNAIYWEGNPELKEQLRKYSFRASAGKLYKD